MAATQLMTADTFTYFANTFQQQWGIFQNGVAIVTADTVTSFEYRQEWIISDFPVEGGAFQSYDKVFVPFDARFRFVAGGSEANRAALLASIQAIAGNLTLYDAASPEAIYIGCNIRHFDYRRTSIRGVGMIEVDVWLEQVMVTNSPQNNASQPSGADPTNLGNVQPSTSVTPDLGAAPGVTSANPIGRLGGGAGVAGGNAGNLGTFPAFT
jgi:hypothetical protein